MAHLTNFSFEFFYEIFTEDASLRLLYHGAKKSKMTKNSNQGGHKWTFEANRLTLIYTATLSTSRFGSGPCIRRPTAVQARSHLNAQLPNADIIIFFFWSEKKGGSSAPSEPPLATCLNTHR